jgi:imidazolonepropionase-like amidohydrolase
MKRLLRWAIAILLVSFQARAAAPPLLIENVTIVHCTSSSSGARHAVLIEDGRISAVAKSGELKGPANAKLLDGTGRFLIPGLWDMHVHVLWGAPEQFLPLFIVNGVTGVRDLHTTIGAEALKRLRADIAAGVKVGPRLVSAGPIMDGPQPVWPDSISIHNAAEARRAVRRVKREGYDMAKVYERLSRESYFAVLDEAKKEHFPVTGHTPQALTPEEVALAGQKCIEHLSRVLESCEVSEGEAMTPPTDPDPELTQATRRSLEAAFTNHYRRDDFTAGANEFLDSPDGAVWKARHAERGPMTSFVHYKAEAREAERRFLYRAGFGKEHVFFALERNAAGKIRFVSGTTVFDEKREAALFALFKEHQTWQCPTLAVRVRAYRTLDDLRDDPRVKYLSRDARERAHWPEALTAYPLERAERFDQLLKTVGRMQQAGIPLLAGTDAMMPYVLPGYALHDELELLERAGLSPLAALEAATLNPARFLGVDASTGTIEPGKSADLVLLEANPLEHIGNTRKIVAVIAQGRLFERSALDELLSQLAGSIAP